MSCVSSIGIYEISSQIISIRFVLSCCSIFKDRSCHRSLRQPGQYSTSRFVCQVLFQKFFKLFCDLFFAAVPSPLFNLSGCSLCCAATFIVQHFVFDLSIPFSKFFKSFFKATLLCYSLPPGSHQFTSNLSPVFSAHRVYHIIRLLSIPFGKIIDIFLTNFRGEYCLLFY